MLIKIRNWFLTGVMVSVPIVITLYIVYWIIDFFDNLIIVNLLPIKIAAIPGVGIVLSVVLMITVGAITKNFLGKYFLNLAIKLLNKIPLVKTLYSTIKQLFDTIMSSNSQAFKEAVLIEYPRSGLWMVGFVTTEDKGEISTFLNKQLLTVFIPTTPNPTSGFLVYVPKEDVIHLKMKSDEAMKLIISAGVVNSKKEKI
jgi:uncharacterized membrane protein